MNRKIFFISVLVICIDQISKAVVDTIFSLQESLLVIKNFFYITYHNNYGAAWGIMQNKTTLLIVLSLFALVIIYSQIYTFKNNKRNNFAFGLITGGIIGNLIDRLFLGYVRDFIDFYIFNYDFPILNIADAAIVIGVIILIIAIIKGEDKNNEVSSRDRITSKD